MLLGLWGEAVNSLWGKQGIPFLGVGEALAMSKDYTTSKEETLRLESYL